MKDLAQHIFDTGVALNRAAAGAQTDEQRGEALLKENDEAKAEESRYLAAQKDVTSFLRVLAADSIVQMMVPGVADRARELAARIEKEGEPRV